MSRKLDAIRKADAEARRATEKRDQLIREVAETESLRTIAQAVGLSHQRIHQIVKGE